MSQRVIESWSGLEDLDEGQTILLEASAGTGKTYQIAGLVARLVAQYRVPIDRILVITFTNAATAELKKRVRERLAKARDAMASNAAPTDDAILAALWDDGALRDERRALLEAALSGFDQAPISTIHGFCQRMLGQLAFESGQEPDLTLVKSVKTVTEELVDDAVADVFAQASRYELQLLRQAKWNRKALIDLAGEMTRAVEPIIEPSVPTSDKSIGQLAIESLRRWPQAIDAFQTWWDGPEGQAALAAMDAEAAKANKKREVASLNPGNVEKWRVWRRELTRDCVSLPKRGTPLKSAWFEKNWKAENAPGGDYRDFAGYPLCERVEQLIAECQSILSAPRAYFASKIRALVDAELKRMRQLAFSSLISRLARQIETQGREDSPLAEAIRNRFDVALIDEFQDTDGAQWPIMSAVFHGRDKRLLLVGDPKQAIYSFRGADVHVYMEAAAGAHIRATMKTNWRSDADYVAAMNHLFNAGTKSLGLDKVDYIEVSASPKHTDARIRHAPDVNGRPRRPFELRWVDAAAEGLDPGPVGNKARAELLSAHLAAREAAVLLSQGTQVVKKDGDASNEDDWRALQPGDIAVLVRSNKQGQRMWDALNAYGIPAVTGGRGSIFSSDAAVWLTQWLETIGNPRDTGASRRLVTSPLFGWTANRLAQALAEADAAGSVVNAHDSLGEWDRWVESIRSWAKLWSKRGFIGAFDASLDGYGVLERILTSTYGERAATDLRHLTELCHAEERRTRTGPLGLAEWLRQKRLSADDKDDAESIRLESDARAVQIITIHKAKGLEWPVVLLPFGWADFTKVGDKDKPVTWHHTDDSGQQTLRLNLELKGAPFRERAVAAGKAELDQENRRLLYVALTRAGHHCVAWMGPLGKDNETSHHYALGEVALRDEHGKPAQDDPWQSLQALAARSESTIGVHQETPLEEAQPIKLGLESKVELMARVWNPNRALKTAWQVASYSSMVKGRTSDDEEPQRPELTQGIVPEDRAVEADGAKVEVETPDELVQQDKLIPSAGLYGGTEVGTWVHEVYEHLDFKEAKGLEGEALSDLIRTLGSKHSVTDSKQHDEVEKLVLSSLKTPIGGGASGLNDNFSLADIARSDRVDEMAFDLKVGSGTRWCRGAVGDLRLDADLAMRALNARTNDTAWGGDAWLQSVIQRAQSTEGKGVLPRIAGILTGLIDLTFRVGDRYFVADYKTNRIAPVGEKRNSCVGHYNQAWMAWEMAHHGYHLQALLYTVALHRLLKLRLGDTYDYDKHIGGHFYLFVRGMTGADAPRDKGLCRGVYFDRWPKAVVEGIDLALYGGAAATPLMAGGGAP